MTYVPNKANTEVNVDAAGRTRVSQLVTFFDGKILGADDSLGMENVGTGTGLYGNNKYQMSVTSGQYLIRRSKMTVPYFVGKGLRIECTFDGFNVEANVEKSVGYYSSAPSAPYNTDLDGFRLHNDGTTIRLQCYRNGTITADVPFSQWDNYEQLASYNWANFTIATFDFLWLGGSELRLFLKTDSGFIQAHTIGWASDYTDTFIGSPQKSVRYELRSTTGSGSFRYVCSHAGVDGYYFRNGRGTVAYNTTGLVCNAVGTTYALKGVKKSTSFRDICLAIDGGYVVNTGTSDAGIILMLMNPTLSTPLTYTSNGKILEGEPTSGTTVTNPGRVVWSAPSSSTGGSIALEGYYMSSVGMTIDNVSDEFVLAYLSVTSNQSVHGAIRVKEF